MARISGETRIARTARALVKLSLASKEGAFLGPESELLARLNVSRPTLRQAAKIVESDRLISVRRGVKGGFYATRPDARDAIRSLAGFLRLRGATMADILMLAQPICEQAAGLAASCAEEELRAELEQIVDDLAEEKMPHELIRIETEVAAHIASMSGNPAIELFMAIAYSFGMEERGLAMFQAAEQRDRARKLQRDLCIAILSGDADVARLMMRRRGAAMALWVDQAGRP